MNCSLASGNGVLVVNEVTALFGEPQSRLGSIVISQRLSWLIRWYLKKSETTRFPYRRRKGFLLLLGGSNQGTKKLFSHGSLIRSYLTILLSFFTSSRDRSITLIYGRRKVSENSLWPRPKPGWYWTEEEFLLLLLAGTKISFAWFGPFVVVCRGQHLKTNNPCAMEYSLLRLENLALMTFLRKVFPLLGSLLRLLKIREANLSRNWLKSARL